MNLFRRSNEPDAVRAARERALARASESGASTFEAMRAPPRPQDLVLSPVAQAWVDALPGAKRPQALCAQYPRIANRIALCWSDATLAAQVIDQFLVDRRGSRRGFPHEVREDLLALRDLAVRRRTQPCIDGLEVQEFSATDWGLHTRGIGNL